MKTPTAPNDIETLNVGFSALGADHLTFERRGTMVVVVVFFFFFFFQVNKNSNDRTLSKIICEA